MNVGFRGLPESIHFTGRVGKKIRIKEKAGRVRRVSVVST